jgi:hypothetical protein
MQLHENTMKSEHIVEQTTFSVNAKLYDTRFTVRVT